MNGSKDKPDLVLGFFVLLAIAYIMLWVLGVETPEEADIRSWIALGFCIFVLGIVAFFVAIRISQVIRQR